MGYQLKPGEPFMVGLRRIASEQIERAIAEVEDKRLDPHETVHQVRKRCKKIRAVVRLIRTGFEETYQVENTWYRQASRRLSYVRDAQALIETYDQLLDHYQDDVDRQAFAPIRRKLTLRLKEISEDEIGLHDRLAEFVDRMERGRRRIDDWQIDQPEDEAVVAGLDKTYARGVTAFEKAYKKPKTERFHEWRKRVKYHWYHLRILQPIWQQPLKARRKEAGTLADLLGDDHDLAVFHETVVAKEAEFAGEETIEVLAGLISQRQAELRDQANQLGDRLFAEASNAFGKRFETYVQNYQNNELGAATDASLVRA